MNRNMNFVDIVFFPIQVSFKFSDSRNCIIFFPFCRVVGERPVCQCRPGHSKNKFTGVCEPVTGCASDTDCRPSETCAEAVFGTKTCTEVCSLVKCPPFSVCVSKDHRGYCKCQEGYTGVPNSR